MKLANWSARNTVHSLPGLASRAATTARQARAVALSRALGAGENGIPYRRKESCPSAPRSGVKPRLTYWSAFSVRPMSTRFQSSWSP